MKTIKLLFILIFTFFQCEETTNNDQQVAAIALLAANNRQASTSNITVSSLTLTESGKTDANRILNQPEDLTLSSDGKIIYVADSKNNRIVKIENETTVSEIVPSTGNGGTITVVNNPEGITTGANGILYVANSGASSATSGAFDGHNVFSINTNSNNSLTLIAGANRPTLRETIDGSLGTNRVYKAEGIRYDSRQNKLAVGENGGQNVRTIDLANNTITTNAGFKSTGGATVETGTPIATDGAGTTARFNGVKGVVFDSKGNIYVADNANHCIRKIDTSNIVSTYAGSNLGTSDLNTSRGFRDGNGQSARFNGPYMLVIDSNDTIYVADAGNYAIRKISSDATVTTVAGGLGQGRTDGNASVAKFYNPIGIAIYGNTLYVTDKSTTANASAASTDYSVIRKISNIF